MEKRESLKDFTLEDFGRLSLEERINFLLHLAISPLEMLVLLAMKKDSKYKGVSDIKRDIIKYFQELNIPTEETSIYLGYMNLNAVWKRIRYDRKLSYVLLEVGDSYVLTEFGEELKRFIKYLIKTYVTNDIQPRYLQRVLRKSDKKYFIKRRYLHSLLERIRKKKSGRAVVEYIINPIIDVANNIYNIRKYQTELKVSDIKRFLFLYNKNIVPFEEIGNKILEILPCESNGNGITLVELSERLGMSYFDLKKYLGYLRKMEMVRKEEGRSKKNRDKWYKIC